MRQRSLMVGTNRHSQVERIYSVLRTQRRTGTRLLMYDMQLITRERWLCVSWCYRLINVKTAECPNSQPHFRSHMLYKLRNAQRMICKHDIAEEF